MSDYLHVPGSGLEIPGVEAKLEYGDDSAYKNGRIPGTLLINDRSMPDQVRVTELSGLHDDPDVSDSRSEVGGGHWGERLGLLVPRGRTVGVTGSVRSNGVNRMRDLWRRTRSQFAREAQDLLVHPVGEPPLHRNLFSSDTITGWAGGSSAGSVTAMASFTEGNLVGLQHAVTGVPASVQTTFIARDFIPWDGEDLWMTALVKMQAAAATVTSIALQVITSDAASGYTSATWTATGAGIIATPTTGNWYLLVARMPASTATPGTALYPLITVTTPGSSGTYTLRAARIAYVLVDPDDPSPGGYVSGALPGFEYEGVPAASSSVGPCYAVNQVHDPDSEATTLWANDSTSGATVDLAGIPSRSWPEDVGRSISWAIRNPNTTSRTLAIRSPATLTDPNLYVVAGGRSYRVHLSTRVTELFTTANVSIVWLDQNLAALSTTIVDVLAAVAPAGTPIEDEVSGIVVAPALAHRAYMRVSSTTASTVTNNRMTIMVAEPRFVDVSEYDMGPVAMDKTQPQDLGVLEQTPSRSGTSLAFTPAGARRRIPRPFLLRKVRSLWDGKAPESQRGLQAARDFTMSLRSADPRVYVRELRHAYVRFTGSSTFVSASMSAFRNLFLAAPVPVVADDFVGIVGGSALNARVSSSGATWTTSGDTTDLTGYTSTYGVQRSTTTGSTVGRFAILGSTSYINVDVFVSLFISAAQSGSGTTSPALLARYVDNSNHLRVVVDMSVATSTYTALRIESVVSGTPTTLASATISVSATAASYSLRMMAYPSGRVIAYLYDTNSGVVASMLWADSSVVATGGTLATGKVGIRDFISGTISSRGTGFTNFSARTQTGDPGGPPPGFTNDGTSLTPQTGWSPTNIGGSPWPLDGVALSPLTNVTTYLSAASLARIYRTLEGYTYTTPQVTVGGDVLRTYANNTIPTSIIGGAWQYNYIGCLLKRVSGTTWIEARYNLANQVEMNAVTGSPTAPQSLELWCSHNASGTLATTKLAGWDVPLAYIYQDAVKYVRSYMTTGSVVYVELWNQPPNLSDVGLLSRQSYTVSGGLVAVVGAGVAGSAGALMRLARWSDGTSGYTGHNLAMPIPFLTSFEAIDFQAALNLISCPVIGDADDTPLEIQLRGNIDSPNIMVTNVEEGRSTVLRLTGVFTDADPVTINMDEGTIKSAAGVNYFDRRVIGSRFSSLGSGQNVIAVQAAGWDAGAAVHLIASWRDALR